MAARHTTRDSGRVGPHGRNVGRARSTVWAFPLDEEIGAHSDSISENLSLPAVEALDGVPPEALPSLALHLAALQGRVAARMAVAPANAPSSAPGREGDCRLLPVPEVANELRVAPAYVYELIRRGRFPAIRFGKYVRVRADDLRAWIATHRGPCTPG
jgi:excisionase family DNA binding protein